MLVQIMSSSSVKLVISKVERSKPVSQVVYHVSSLHYVVGTVRIHEGPLRISAQTYNILVL